MSDTKPDTKPDPEDHTPEAEAELRTGADAEAEADDSSETAEDGSSQTDEADATPPEDEPSDEPARASSGFVPLALGGGIAAAFGAGLMYLFQPAPPEFPTDRIAALETALAELQDAPAPTIDIPEVDLSALDSMSERVTLLESAIAELGTKLDDVALLGAGDGSAASAAVVAQLSEMRAALADQQAENAAVQQEIETITAQAAEDVAAAEARAGDVQAAAAEREALAAERAALAAQQANVAQLQAAIETGAPFSEVLAALDPQSEVRTKWLNGIAQTGAPTLVALQSSFGDAARDGLAASVKATMGDSAGERFTAFLQAQIGARSLTPREGDDPDAVLSRAEAALRAGQIAEVLEELKALPQAGQDAMKPWIDQAKARREALRAIAAFTTAPTEN